MTRMNTILLATATLTAPALATPETITFSRDDGTSVELTDFIPSAPDIKLTLERVFFYDGGDYYSYHPMIVDGTADGDLLRPEAANIGYLDNDGLLIENAITTEWVTTPPQFDDYGILPQSHFYDAPDNECPQGCPRYGSSYNDLGPLYIPFRWHTDEAPSDYYYGWVSFKVVTLTQGFSCDYPGDSDVGCPPYQGTYRRNEFRWVGAGYETEPNTPIVASLYCPADFNYDGGVDVFDLFEFLDLFNSMNPIADLTEDGVFDIFDAYRFLNLYGSPCEF